MTAPMLDGDVRMIEPHFDRWNELDLRLLLHSLHGPGMNEAEPMRGELARTLMEELRRRLDGNGGPRPSIVKFTMVDAASVPLPAYTLGIWNMALLVMRFKLELSRPCQLFLEQLLEAAAAMVVARAAYERDNGVWTYHGSLNR